MKFIINIISFISVSYERNQEAVKKQLFCLKTKTKPPHISITTGITDGENVISVVFEICFIAVITEDTK